LDEGIEKAIQIGESNAEIIKLAENWCAHLEVEKSAGTGLVELQTGLPIGMRSFKCEHASAAGWAGMDLAHIVLDFYDATAPTARSSEMFGNLNGTRLQRQALSDKSDDATLAIFDAVDSLDRDPSAHNTEVLKPSLSGSPWMRGAPQIGFSATLRKIRPRISSLMRLRPPILLVLESHFQ
jgi:hypothetical protein